MQTAHFECTKHGLLAKRSRKINFWELQPYIQVNAFNMLWNYHKISENTYYYRDIPRNLQNINKINLKTWLKTQATNTYQLYTYVIETWNTWFETQTHKKYKYNRNKMNGNTNTHKICIHITLEFIHLQKYAYMYLTIRHKYIENIYKFTNYMK